MNSQHRSRYTLHDQLGIYGFYSIDHRSQTDLNVVFPLMDELPGTRDLSGIANIDKRHLEVYA